MKNDREIVLAAVTRAPEAFQNASDDLKRDRDVVLEAVKKNGEVLRYARAMNDYREIVLEAVKRDPVALEYASDELKNDREIVRVAVEKDGLALLYASDELKNNPEIVHVAVEKDGRALKYASDELQSSWEMVLLAEGEERIKLLAQIADTREAARTGVSFEGVDAWISKEASSWQLMLCMQQNMLAGHACAPGIHEVAKKSGAGEAVLKAKGPFNAYNRQLEVVDAITDEEVFTLENDVHFTGSGYSKKVDYRNYYIMQGGGTCLTIFEDNLWFMTNCHDKWWPMDEHTMLVCEGVSQRHLFTMKGSAIEGSPNHVNIYQGTELLASAQEVAFGRVEIKLNAGIDVALVLALVMTYNQHICRPMTEYQGGR
jgi:hypothetical protein